MGKHFDRAQILIEQNRYDLAEKELREEIAENPDFDRAYSNLALCLINQQNLGSETLDLIDYALSLNVENDWNHYLLAMYWYNKDDLNRARLSIEVAIELDPNSSFYFHILACILFDRGKNKFTIDVQISRGLLSICESYFIRSYLKSVFPPLEKSLALDPNYLPAINLMTNLLITTGRTKRALLSSRAALSIDPNHAITHKLHGQILTELGKYTVAIEHFQSALSIDPNFQEAKDGLLEAMRSQYWIYPLISMTNWRGKLVFFLTFPVGIFAAILVRDLASRFIYGNPPLELVIFAITIAIVVVSFPAQWIFNLFLQLDPKNKFLITVRDAIIANYAAGLTGTILLSIYATMLFDNTPTRTTAMTIVAILGGIVIPIVTFLPVHRQTRLSRKSLKLSIGYQLGVGILGIINIAIYFKFHHLGIFGYLFASLVLISFLAAIHISEI
jgi:tetratricopeptide (TPR) repeat protein